MGKKKENTQTQSSIPRRLLKSFGAAFDGQALFTSYAIVLPDGNCAG